MPSRTDEGATPSQSVPSYPLGNQITLFPSLFKGLVDFTPVFIHQILDDAMNLQGIFCSRMIAILCSSQNTFIEDGYDDFSLFSIHHIFIFIIFLVVPILGTCPVALVVIQHLRCQETILNECCLLGLHEFIHLAVEQQKGIERHSLHDDFPFFTLCVGCC